MGSIVSFCGSAVYAIAALSLGLAADTLGPVNAIIIGALLQLLAIPFFLRAFRRHQK